MRSNESSEDYLETILILGNKSSLVRAVDIASEMGFKKPSVSVAMKNLRQKNLITVADNGDIRLTEEGHKILQNFINITKKYKEKNSAIMECS